MPLSIFKQKLIYNLKKYTDSWDFGMNMSCLQKC